MPRVVHTADVHLRSEHPERLHALRAVLQLAEEEAVDVVTIGGDLFDNPGNVEQLRTDLRNDLFSDQPFEILLIPGNHDIEAYRGDVFFGDSCTVFTEDPFSHWTSADGEFRITGLPYRERADDDLLLALQNRDSFDGTEVLLLHCSLDAPFDDYDTGDEDARRYFPVTEELLVELGFDYYLAGHYHTPHKVSFEDGAEFTYPGTPASTSAAETGQRRVSVLTPSEGVSFRSLNTYHRASREFTVVPGAEEKLLEDIQEWVAQHVTSSTEASVHVTGFVDMPEDDFNEQLTAVAGSANVTDETRGVEHILSHPLYRQFEDELEEIEWDDDVKAGVRERTLEVFSQLSVRGEI